MLERGSHPSPTPYPWLVRPAVHTCPVFGDLIGHSRSIYTMGIGKQY